MCSKGAVELLNGLWVRSNATFKRPLQTAVGLVVEEARETMVPYRTGSTVGIQGEV